MVLKSLKIQFLILEDLTVKKRSQQSKTTESCYLSLLMRICTN
jgi:hypothetical protein